MPRFIIKEVETERKIIMEKMKHKKVVIAALLLLVLLIGIVGTAFQRGNQQRADMINQVETAVVEKRTLVSSVSATGTISSVQSKDIVAEVNGVKMKTLSVEVGDYVEAGEVLCKFDSSDLEESIADAQTSLDNAVAKSNIDVESAQRSLNEAKNSSDIANYRNAQASAEAYTEYEEQVKKVEALQTELNDLNASEKEINSQIEEKTKQIAEKEAEISAAGENADTSALNTQLQTLQGELQTLQKNLQTTQTSISTKNTELTQAQKTEASLYDAYTNKLISQDDAVRSNASSIASKEASLETATINASTTGQSDKQQIENYQKQVAACTVKAPMSGVITSINLEEGDTYNGSVIMTIEDDSSYVVEAQIDEYDIGKIQLGQEVVIKTNATGDEELEGTVIQIAPRATSSSQTGSSVSYAIKISIDTPNEMIRMDMTAKLSIILEKKENVVTVPYDAVCEDEEGKFYVEVVEETNETEPEKAYQKVYVTKGIESDYYIEILGEELKEGAVVVVPKSQDTDVQTRIMQGGPMGGF